MVETGAEETMENGLGAAYRLQSVLHRLRWERPLQRQGIEVLPVG